MKIAQIGSFAVHLAHSHWLPWRFPPVVPLVYFRQRRRWPPVRSRGVIYVRRHPWLPARPEDLTRWLAEARTAQKS